LAAPVHTQQRNTPLTAIAWLGHCGITVLKWIPRGILLLCTGFLTFCKDFAHGTMRVLRWLRRILTTPIRLREQTAEAVYAEWTRARGQSPLHRIRAVCKMIGIVLLSENGILVSLFRFAAPLLCCAFLWSVVSYGANLDYVIAVEYNGTQLGYIAEEADYTTAQQIVQQRLSYTDEEYEISFQRNFRLILSDGDENILSSGQLADRMLQCADISLCTGYGVYVDDEFFGAVSDTQPIQDALAKQLSAYSDMLGGLIDNISYAKEVRYVEGTYLAENLVNANTIARQLTKTEETFRTYTVRKGDSIYTIAAKYTTTAEKLRELNPDMPDVPELSERVRVPVTTHFIPIVYQKTTDVTSFIDYDVVRIETMLLPIGTEKVMTEGVKGEKLNTVQITYIDGAESERVILSSQLVSAPVDEELGVGIYEAAPASTSTVLAGSGQFAWPLDGGRVSDTFGGARGHGGIDLAAPAGTNIYAADDGVITFAGWHSSYGNYLIIDHENGYQTLYAHCTTLLAGVEQEVSRGQLIALVGTTGHSTGNHLHFEVRFNGTRLDPALYLRVNAES